MFITFTQYADIDFIAIVFVCKQSPYYTVDRYSIFDSAL